MWLVTHCFSLNLNQYYQSGNLHFKTDKKISDAFVFMLQEMKAVTKSNQSLGVHPIV